jgi:AcrR family transcriptional regulator
MARPVHADAEATRKRILKSAVLRFSDLGIDGASIRAIARGADVSLAMVHHYFGSKDDLYRACVDSMYESLAGLRTELERELRLGGSTHEVVERAVVAGFRFARKHQTAMRLLLRAVMESGELDPERRQREQLPFLASASRALGAALGRPAHELRLPLQSIVALTARYAVSTERELAAISGQSSSAIESVERHLVDVALALLGSADERPFHPGSERSNPESGRQSPKAPRKPHAS